jgi:alkylation response protein AidB-like acyl-CoA dehydrogenase
MAATATPRTQADRLRTIDGLANGFRKRRRAYDDAAAFPTANFDELREAGLLALTIPSEYGGDDMWWGSNFVSYYEILERLARVDSCTAQLLQVHSHATGVLSRHATGAQCEKFLPDIVQNGKLVASVGSESAPRSTKGGDYMSELVEGSRGWRLTCKKHFASLGPAADYLMIWVAVPGAGSYAERTVLVLVPRDAPEVELVNEWDVMGMRSTVSWGVQVTDYEVPDDAIIGEPGGWVKNDPRTFTLGFTANHVGAAQDAFDFTTDWVRNRPHLAQSELVQVLLGQLSSEIFAARAGLFAAARIWEQGDYDLAELESLKALHLAKRVALDVTERAFDVCGARVAFRSFPLEQMLRDVRTFTLHFRDELYMRQVGQAVVGQSFSAKGFTEGTPLRQA